MDNSKRDLMIKEIKTIYSGRIRSTNPMTSAPRIASVNPMTKSTTARKSSFFNNVIDKLNIAIEDK